MGTTTGKNVCVRTFLGVILLISSQYNEGVSGSVSVNPEAPPLPPTEAFEESLKLRSLPNGHFFAHFEFTTTISRLSNYTRLFPRTLAEIIDTHSVHELHLSLTQGYWRIEAWGEPELELPSSVAPSGAFVSAWFSSKNEATADSNWSGLTNRLSGLSCASLNFLDSKTSIEPSYAYRPQGQIPTEMSADKKVFVRVGSLPKEHTCTENFTPWSKLLPCGLSRGLASLLRSKKIFSTLYHSSGIHVIRTGRDGELKLVQSLSLVYDLPSGYVKNENVARKIIGSLGLFPCNPSSKTTVEIWQDQKWTEIDASKINSLTLGEIPEGKESDLEFVFTPSKFLGGFGQEYGEMIVEMENHLDQPLQVLYLEVLPWYVRPYFHTMQIAVNKGTDREYSIEPGQMFHYTPGRNREALHKLEMDLSVPAKSTATLTFTVEKGYLKWDEYPPDANHGFYLESSHFELNYTSKANSSGSGNKKIHHYFTRKLLVDLSTPDFSMPYNVICLTCTVVALAFGPIHNITTRRLCLVPVVSTKDKLKKLVNKLLRREIFSIQDSKPEVKDESTAKEEKGENLESQVKESEPENT